MELFTLLGRLPFLPLQGLIRLGELLRDEAERQRRDPAAARRQLEEAATAEASGEIGAEERYDAEREALGQIIGQPGGGDAAGTAGEER